MPPIPGNRRGSAMMELLIITPFYALMLLLVFCFSDIMFIQSKAEVAVRYGAWKRDKKGAGVSEDKFFFDVTHRAQVQDIADEAGLLSYPVKEAPNQGVERRQLDLNSLNQEEGSVEIASIAYDGNDHSGAKYYGAQSGRSRGGGGWLVQQEYIVSYEYQPLGLQFLSGTFTNMGTGAATLNGKTIGAMYQASQHPGADNRFLFRDTEPKQGGEQQVSGEQAALIDHLKPASPSKGF